MHSLVTSSGLMADMHPSGHFPERFEKPAHAQEEHANATQKSSIPGGRGICNHFVVRQQLYNHRLIRPIFRYEPLQGGLKKQCCAIIIIISVHFPRYLNNCIKYSL